MDLKKHYNDRDFKYLWPWCRTNGSSKKRYSKDLRKKQDNYERYKNRFDQVNSGSNILCKSQQLNDQKDSISESQGDDRYYSQNNFANRDDSKYGDSEVEGKDDDFDQDISQQNGGYSKRFKLRLFELLFIKYMRIILLIVNTSHKRNILFHLNTYNIFYLIKLDFYINKSSDTY